jgi:protein TonB
MFEDSLFESSGELAQRNPWATASSFALQMIVAGVLALLPLIYTGMLPKQQLLSFLESPVPPSEGAPAAARIARPKPASEPDLDVLRPPAEIRTETRVVRNEETQAAAEAGVANGVPYGVPYACLCDPITEVIRVPPADVPVRKVPVSSGVAQGLLVRQVKPLYPSLARQARIQGVVVLQAVIGKDGTVQNLQVASGHPMLTQAAIEAVKQWRYKPYYLNGEPIEVATQISVNFTLTGG